MEMYNLRCFDPKSMDQEENAGDNQGYEPKKYIEATLDPAEGTFRVVIAGKTIERVVLE